MFLIKKTKFRRIKEIGIFSILFRIFIFTYNSAKKNIFYFLIERCKQVAKKCNS